MNDGGRYTIWSPILSNPPPTRPTLTPPFTYRVVREMLPRERLGPEELLRLLEAEQLRNERASRAHAKRRAALRASSDTPP